MLYEINSGGCCYTAYCIAKMLEQLEVKFSVIIFDDRQPLRLRKSIQELQGSVCHCALMIEDPTGAQHPVNCDPYDFKNEYRIYQASAKNLLDYYLNYTWNDRYDTEYNSLVQTQIERICHEFIDNLH